MFSLIPKEMAFFALFEKAAKNLLEAAKVLDDLARHFEDVTAKAHRLERLEHDGDQITHEIMARLNQTFITPIDREDIHELASTIDDVLDFFEQAAEHLVLYKIKEIRAPFRELAGVILSQAEQVNAIIPRLKDLKHSRILDHCIEINRLENAGDLLLRQAVAELFEQVKDPLEVLKWKDLYELLETATDKCEDVAVVVEGIVLKHA